MTDKHFIIIPGTEWQTLKEDLQSIKSLILNEKEESYKKKWITSDEARAQLGISKKTWQLYRDKRVIPFSQFGKKIYVLQADIDAFLNSKQIN